MTMKPKSKTGRVRGKIYGLVIYAAMTMPRFTIENLTPALTLMQADRACRNLANTGRLRVIKPGTRGHNGTHTVYGRAR